MHHHRRLDGKGFARNMLGDLGSTPQSLNTAEREADYVGLYLTARAGFDISRAPEFWRRFAADYGDAVYVRWSHPGSAERAANLAATREEILQKLRSGLPLTPTPARLPPAS
jgi:predicted Zn-dependent protease